MISDNKRIAYDDIKHLVGIPWEYRVNDCWAIFKKASLVVDRYIHDLNLPGKSSVKANIRVFEEEIDSNRWFRVDKPSLGCAVVFIGMINNKEKPIHIGFALDSKTILHSMGNTKAVTSSTCDKIDSLIKRGFYKRYEVYDYNM